jgi:multidrug efflux pump subunit AcrA (membrane-fusion protein)
MIKRTLALTAILAGLFYTAACGEKPVVHSPASPVQARVITANTESVPLVLEVPGTVQPRDRIVLSSQINGFVRTVAVQPGDVVPAGKVLATLDARDADSQKAAAQAGISEAQEALAEARQGQQIAASQRDAAKANARLAADTFTRYQKLLEERSATPQELDEVRARRDAAAAELAARETAAAAAASRTAQIQARIAQANAGLQRAEVVVGWTTIKAPAGGRVVERPVDPGSAIFPGSPILILESLTAPQVVSEIPSKQANWIRPGLEVQVAAEPQGTVRGRVTELVPLSSPGTHTVRFKVDLPANTAARSGTFARVLIPTGERQAMLIPRSAIRESGQLTGVFVADSGSVARFRLVKTAPFDSARVEILAGLESGERVVAEPGAQIEDGVPLEIRS